MKKREENFYNNDAFKSLDKSDVKKFLPLFLTEAEVKVFNKRYDESGNVQHSMREIGRMLNISSSRASETLIQIKNKVKLFSKFNKDKFIEFVKSGYNINNNEEFFNYYNRFKLDIISIIDKYNNNVRLNPLEEVLLNYYCEIAKNIDNYSLKSRLSEKAMNVINYIQKNNSLPSRYSKDYDADILSSLRWYYDYLLKSISTIFEKKRKRQLLYPHENDLLHEYLIIRLLLDKNNNFKSIDDILSFGYIDFFYGSEKDILLEIDKLKNPKHAEIIKNILGLNNDTFKSYNEVADNSNYKVIDIYKIVDKFKSKVDYLNGLSNMEIINMINEERKKTRKSMIVSNKLFLLLKYIDEYHNCDNHDYFLYLKRNAYKIIKKIDSDEALSAKEKQLLFEYEQVVEKLSLYGKKGSFIKLIHEYKGKFNTHDRKSLEFEDGSKQFAYYYYLRSNVNRYLRKQASGKKLLYKEQKCLEDYYDIKQVFDIYSKNTMLINIIDKLHRLPRRKTDGIREETFNDGSDPYNYYLNLKLTYESILRRGNDFVTLEDIETLDDYNRIQAALLRNDKVSQLIEIINDIKRAPLSGDKDVKFSDGKSSYVYYMKLREKYYTVLVSNKTFETLNSEEKNIIRSYLLVKKYIEKYSKKKQLIDNIKRIKGVPAKEFNGDESQSFFTDGVIQRSFYYNLVNCARKLEKRYYSGEILNLHDLELIDDYHEISNVSSFFVKNKESNLNTIKRLCYDNHIDISLNEYLLEKSAYEVYVKIKFLLDHNLSLVDYNGIVNSIFYMSDYDLFNTFNVTMDDLVNKYINGNENPYGIEYQKKAIKK